jgi:hypothetical protein
VAGFLGHDNGGGLGAAGDQLLHMNTLSDLLRRLLQYILGVLLGLSLLFVAAGVYFTIEDRRLDKEMRAEVYKAEAPKADEIRALLCKGGIAERAKEAFRRRGLECT